METGFANVERKGMKMCGSTFLKQVHYHGTILPQKLNIHTFSVSSRHF
jgi:hypothetical protein